MNIVIGRFGEDWIAWRLTDRKIILHATRADLIASIEKHWS